MLSPDRSLAMSKAKTYFCVGCGNPVISIEPGAMIAISCYCGALAPILFRGLDLPMIPSSLVFLIYEKREPPHLEYYLGYSDHKSGMKEQMAQELKVLGCTSQEGCEKDRCQERYKKERERLESRGHRQVESSDDKISMD